MRVAIIGGGVPAAVHAWTAVQRGHTVTHLDDGAPIAGSGALRAGSVAAADLERAAHALWLWREIGGRVPGVGFRLSGSITVARTAAELAVAEAAATGADAAARELTLLEPERARALEPALRGSLLAGLHCGADAVLTPQQTVPALRAHLAGTGRFSARSCLARTLAETAAGVLIRADDGSELAADVALLCPGPARDALAGELTGTAPAPLLRVQRLRTGPLERRPDAILADGDQFRHRPGYPPEPVALLAAEQAQTAAAAEFGMHVLAVPRLDGGLTLGATREVEPFPAELAEPAAEHLLAVTGELLSTELTVRGRWAEITGATESPPWLAPSGRILVLGSAGPDGTLLAPAVAEQAAHHLGL
ncbi:NAD(P)/FAD-dependent oxidoreductase [Nocardia sp. NPDC057353]|uniref:NAD(P)/FAD-dependent oxidoreductase n=1 Tax=Nocardia sp. NPDC057353 TaxID=3346104 RepID=UPI0036288B5F